MLTGSKYNIIYPYDISTLPSNSFMYHLSRNTYPHYIIMYKFDRPKYVSNMQAHLVYPLDKPTGLSNILIYPLCRNIYTLLYPINRYIDLSKSLVYPLNMPSVLI